MSKIANELNEVMSEYLSEDEELVKNIKMKGETITFSFDMIDDELLVTIKILEGKFEYSHGKVKKVEENDSFEEFLRSLMDRLVTKQKKRIEYYSNLETPGPGTDTGAFKENTEFPESDSDEEEGEDDLEIEVETPSSELFTPIAKVSSTTLKLLREKPYEVRTPSDLIKMQANSIKKVSETLFVSTAGAKIILRAYRWDIEQIMNTFLVSGKEKVLKDVGLQNNKVEKAEEEEDHKESDEFECPSCYDDLPYKETLRLDTCGHRFCTDCWENHLTIKINDGLSTRILCMGSDCNCVVDENVVSSFIKDPEVKKRYDTKVLESFVEDNDCMKWCQSAPFCGNAAMIRVHMKTPLEVHCKCGKIFCYACLEEAHNPASCKMLQTWRKKCSDDSETLNWIKLHTRDCPKCGKATEKNGGCNHISCKCGAHWCWACGGNFTSSTVYSHKCNRYLEKGGEGEGSRSSLQRYLHYFNHYNKHHTSIRNQKKLQMKMNQQIHKMVRSGRMKLDTLNLGWLSNGLKVLFDTRRALMHSYIFAYYLFDRGDSPDDEEEEKKKKKKKKGDFKKDDNNNNNYSSTSETYHIHHMLRGCRRFKGERERVSAKNLFEDTQEQLELKTEELNKFLDLPLQSILKDHQSDIALNATLNEKRVHGLFDVIRNYMVIDGVYRLPEPRFIVTSPSFEDRDIRSMGFMPTDGSQRKKKPPAPPPLPLDNFVSNREAEDIQRALQASLETAGLLDVDPAPPAPAPAPPVPQQNVPVQQNNNLQEMNEEQQIAEAIRRSLME